MRRRLRLLLVPILAVALPLVALAAIGYQWLTLDREAAARRTQDAALAEATRLRTALHARMASAAAEVDRNWQAADQAWPFALRPRPHLLVTDAYRFTPAGRPEDPDYDAAYQRAVCAGLRAAEGTPASEAGVTSDTLLRARLAFAFLDTGRRALASNRPPAAIEAAESLLECCAAARDEFGVSLSVLAARQLSRAWRRQGLLPAKLPGLVARLVDLVDRGAIGHPNDLIDVEGFIAAAGDPAAAAPLLARLRQSADAVARAVDTAQRLAAWLPASGRPPAPGPAFDAAALTLDGREVIGGRYTRPAGGTLVVLFDTAALASAVADSRQATAFEASLVAGAAFPVTAPAARVPLIADLPGVQIDVHAGPGDSAGQKRRTALFAAALFAALALTLVVAYLGFRDVAREVNVAAQQASFVSSVTHELKTPVASIRLLAETLRMNPAPDAAAAARLLDEIREQADRQSRLIDNVLGVARIDRGLPMYRPADVDVAAVVDLVLGELDYLLRQEGFAVHRTAPDTPLPVCVDSDGLRQAIINLVTNAAKYSGRCRELRIILDRAGSDVRLQIADGGIGIEPSEQRKIFERFYRTPDAARETGGTGLGLALVRHFAESHGGEITVESTPGRGSTFTLRLPAPGSDTDRGAPPAR
jgi:two-component system phosphate regulon sensor histidine kinase PhoR